MPSCVRYTCPHDLLPVLEAALAANGYQIDIPMQRSIGGMTSMVMCSGAATILFTLPPNSTLVELEVSGVAQTAAIQVLESLPIPLEKYLSMATATA